MNKSILTWPLIWLLLSSFLMSFSFAEETAEETKAPTCIKDGEVVSKRMTWEQRKELFVEGTITDCEGQIWNIRMIPGTDKSKEMVIEAWRYAGDRMEDLIKIQTYKDIKEHTVDMTKDSYEFAKNSAEHIKDGIWDEFIVEGLYESLLKETARDWKEGFKTAGELKGKFGWLFGSIYAAIIRPIVQTIGNVLEAAFHATVGIIEASFGVAGTAIGATLTVTSPVLVPVVEVLGRPLLALGSIATKGSTIPGIVYIWNGSAWVTTQLSKIPDEEVEIAGIDFITLENPKQPEKKTMKFTLEEFKLVVEESIIRALADEEREVLLQRIRELEEEVNKLRQQIDGVENEKREVYDKTEQNPIVKAVKDLKNRADRYDTDVEQDQAVKDLLLSDEDLREIVETYANEMELVLDGDQIDTIVAKIKETMNRSFNE